MHLHGMDVEAVRPIALMPMLYRLWTKIRKSAIQTWDVSHRRPRDAAIRGSSALRAAVLSAFHDELATTSGKAVSRVLWNTEKFYDIINITKLAQHACELGYPITAVALGVQMHMAPRILKAHDHYTMCALPATGIIAGCTQSNYFARVLLKMVLKGAMEAVLAQVTRTFVDDISQAVVAGRDIVVSTVRAAHDLYLRLVREDCVISNKTVILSASKKNRAAIARMLHRRGVRVTPTTVGKDLGVGTSAGVRRVNKVLKARMFSIRGRLMRIRMLTMVNKAAARLYSTGAWAAGTYGKEAMGVSPTDARMLRAGAAAAMGGDRGQKCQTTLIWLTLGKEQDPAMKIPVEQVKMWLHIFGIHNSMEVYRAWTNIKSRLEHSDRPWSSVKGPMGATIMTMKQLGWNPLGPSRWIDHEDNTWQITADCSATVFIQAIKDRITQRLWSEAMDHRWGSGVEGGIDFTVIRRMCRAYLAKCLNSLHAMLLTIASGGLWPNDRKAKAGLIYDDACQLCNSGARQDELHLIWQCPVINTNTDPAIQRSNHLIQQACNSTAQWFWMRGLVPKEWTHRTVDNEYDVWHVHSGDDKHDPVVGFDSNGDVYLDGSGGVNTKDPRIRTCGCAWAQPLSGGQRNDAVGMYATILGYQSVPRAELHAFSCLLHNMFMVANVGTINAYTDCAMVFKGFHKGPSTSNGRLGDIWEEVWSMYKMCIDGLEVTHA